MKEGDDMHKIRFSSKIARRGPKQLYITVPRKLVETFKIKKGCVVNVEVDLEDVKVGDKDVISNVN